MKPGTKARVRSQVTSRLRRKDVSPPSLARLADRVLTVMGRPRGSVSILLTGDGEVRSLNALWRGMDRPTDVLSFPLEEGEPLAVGEKSLGGVEVLGDVVISLERAREQAREAGVPLGEELARLLVHGVLHLLGHDHEASPVEARRMRTLERRFLGGSAG